MSRTVSSRMIWWLRSTPSGLAPGRSIACRDCWLSQCVRRSTAMQSRRSNAWPSSSSLLGVHPGALGRAGEPGVADLDPPVLGVDVAESRVPDDLPGVAAPDRERHRLAGVVLPPELGDGGAHLLRAGHPGVAERAQIAVTGRGDQAVVVIGVQRAQFDRIAGQRDRVEGRHAGERTGPVDRFCG